ncbi:hypothetical protein PIB30_000920 [Stylosanthes scabra]|uniref:DUF761 domain-containing protein n=1 Tax=Stylosanthes scabra TaxID=79078 RepID=A0ABU6S304_9FABA|nr:hypothetical protein [Stylosanthes scabra]
MFSQSSNVRSNNNLQVFSVKASTSLPPSSSLSSMKLKRIIHTLIVSHMCRIIRALSKVKEFLLEILNNNPTNDVHHFPYTHKKRRNKIIMGSFRLHYNWCSSKSSHVLPVPQRVYEGLCCDEESSSSIHHNQDCPESQLAGYLRWLEEKKVEEGSEEKEKEKEMNEIDVLAEMFIANCHEKFRLEKQESDRRFQEMLARSM